MQQAQPRLLPKWKLPVPRRPWQLGMQLLLALGLAPMAFANLELSVVSVSGNVLSANVVNRSAQLVNNEVVFYRGNPLSGGAQELGRVAAPMAANASTRLTINTVATANTIYTACVNVARTLPEPNYNDNCKTYTNSTQSVDLSVATRNVRFKPVGVDPGEPFQTSVPVRNNSAIEGQAVVRLYQGEPGSPAAKLLGQVPLRIAPRSSALATWNLIRPAGDPNVWVAIEDVIPRESSPADNEAPSNLYLKAFIPKAASYNRAPVIGDLLGTGHPVAVYPESTALPDTIPSLVAMQVNNDGSYREVWRKPLAGKRSIAGQLVMADLDRDGSAEVIVEVAKNLTDGPTRDSEIMLLALDKNGNVKWSRSWTTPGRVTCHYSLDRQTPPTLGDLNKDGVADVVVLEQELVVLDGRTGGELLRKPGLPGGCSYNNTVEVADVDNNGTNEILVADRGLALFSADGALLWHVTNQTFSNFALLDAEGDGAPEVAIPIHRTALEIRNAVTGSLKRRIPLDLYSDFLAVTTGIKPDGLPTVIVSTNSSSNSLLAVDPASGLTTWNQKLWPVTNWNVSENPHRVALADLLGLGRPQLISHGDRRYLGIQDSKTGEYLNYLRIFGSSDTASDPPAIADLDADGHGDIVVPFGALLGQTGLTVGETRLPAAALLVFSSDKWIKTPTVWNRGIFVAGQVDRNLSFKHDYRPWKTHNTWMQQPLRAKCDVDYDEDVDQADIAEITAARGLTISAGDWRDVDGDGAVTVADSRACVLKCTLPNCTGISVGPRILSVSPVRGVPGTSMRLTIRTEFLGLQQGAASLNFGPGISVDAVTVVDANTAVAQVTIAPSATGARTLTLANAGKQAVRADAFLLSESNRPPAVKLGGDQQVLVGGTLTLTATITDDAVPAPAGLAWQLLSGPAQVHFTSPNAAVTAVTFPAPGYYRLRLSATDGEFSGVDDLGVSVIPGNVAPLVSAGPDRGLEINKALTLNGEVLDDGLPFASPVSLLWSKVSGPGTVTFGAATSAITPVTFSQPGLYVLRLSASDTQLAASDDVTVTVNPPLAEIEGLGPDSATPNQTRTITISGRFTNFANGTTVASFGPGVSVGDAPEGAFGPVQVLSPTLATAQVRVAGAAALGRRTVTLRTGAQQAAKADAFLVGALGAPASIRPNLTDLVVAPDGEITARPELVDAGGNVLANNAGFLLSITPKANATTGNPPVVNGLTVRFPKLVKRLLNQDLTKDPTGEFTDGDPSDPNWGKETGGLYTLTLRIPNTALQTSVEVAVLPSGTAHLTLLSKRHAEQLEAAFAAAASAAARQDWTALQAAKDRLQAITSTLEFRKDLSRFNNVLTPPNGHPVTAQQMAGRFVGSPDDAPFSRLLDSLSATVRTLTTQIKALNLAAPSQAELDALRTQVETFRTLQAQLERLNPSPLGVTQNMAKLNNYLRLDLPLLLEAAGNKGLQVVGLMPTGNALRLQSGLFASADGPVRTAGFDPLTFFSNTLSIMTDLTKYTKSNVIELVASLANDLVNIAIAGIANAIAPPGLGIDAVVASASPQIVCPRHPNTYVEGYGFGDKHTSSVAVIGCIDSYAIRNMLSLSKPKDLAAATRLAFKIKSLMEAVGRDQSIATIEYPESDGPGLFGPKRLSFPSGWPRVNQGRIPCVGVVIVFNHETGSFQAVNMNVLGECGG